MIDLSIIVLTWNTRELTLGCLESVAAALDDARAGDGRALEAEVRVVDNASTDGTADAIAARFPAFELICLPENRGYAAGNNAGIRGSRGRVLLLLNSDARIERAAIESCLGWLERRPDVGIVGVQTVGADGRLQNAIHNFPGLWTQLLPLWLLETLRPRAYPSKRRRHAGPIEVEAVLGAALFVRRAAVDVVGLLDEGYFFFLEETDWCWRMRQSGWRVLHVPDARVWHLAGASSKARFAAETRIEFHRSLYRFLRRRRGAATARLAAAVRLLRAAGTALLLAPLAVFQRASRRRLEERVDLIRWHLAGFPESRGLGAAARARAQGAQGADGEADSLGTDERDSLRGAR